MATILGRVSFALLLSACFASTLSAQSIEGPAGGKIFVNVTQNRELVGTPIELGSIKAITGFGEVAIPLDKIDGIKLHVDADDSAVIAFKNGDLVTAKINLDQISLKTVWGKAHIKLDQVETIVASSSARFYPETTNGTKGWRFSNGAPVEQ